MFDADGGVAHRRGSPSTSGSADPRSLARRRRPHARHVVTLGAGLGDGHCAAPGRTRSRCTTRSTRSRGRSVREPEHQHVDVPHVAGELRAADSARGWRPPTALLPRRVSPRASPRLELYELQGPAIARHRLTSRERDQAALLQSFAVELAELGVPAVMTLPPLRRARARDALAAVAAELGPRAESRTAPAASHAGRAGGDRAWARAGAEDLEVALQTCLYVAGDLASVYRLLKLVAFEPIAVSRIPREGEPSRSPRS